MSTQRAAKKVSENPVLNLNLNLETEQKKPTASIVPVMKITPKEEVQPIEVPPLTMSQLTERSEKLHLLSVKYNSLQEKRKELERFKISHNSNSAQMSIVDSQGLTFESSNPGSMTQVIEIWKEDFEKVIEATEKEMRSLFL